MRFQFRVIAFALCAMATGAAATFFESDENISNLESRIFKSKTSKPYPTLKRYRKIGGWHPESFASGSYSDDPIVHEIHRSPVYKVQRYRGYESRPVTVSGLRDVSFHVSGSGAESHSSGHFVNDDAALPISHEFLFPANEKPISTSRLTYAPHHDHHTFSFSSTPVSFFNHRSHPLKFGTFFKPSPFIPSSSPYSFEGLHFGSGHASFPTSFTFVHPEYSYASFFPSFPTESHSIQLPPSPSFVPGHPVHFPFPPISIAKPGLPYFPGYHHTLPPFPAPTLPVLPPPLPTKIPVTTDSPILSSVTPLPPVPSVSLQPPPVPSVSLQPPPVPSVSLQPPPVPSVSLQPPPVPSTVQQQPTFSHRPVFPSFSSTPSPFFPNHPKLEFSFPPSTVQIPTYVKDVSLTTPSPEKVADPHDEERHNEQQSSVENAPGFLDKIKSWKVEKASQALNHLQKHLGVADKTSAAASGSDHLQFPETVHGPSSESPQSHPFPLSQSSHSTKYESFPPNSVQTPSSSLFDSYGIPIPQDAYSSLQQFYHDRVSSAASEEKGAILPPPTEFAEKTEILNAGVSEPEIDQEFQIQDLQRINPKLRPIYIPKRAETGEHEDKTVEELVPTTGNVNQEKIDPQQNSKSNSSNHEE